MPETTSSPNGKISKPKRRPPLAWIENYFDRNKYFPNADDESLEQVPELLAKPRLKLALSDAVVQGIVTTKGVNPNWLVVIPLKSDTMKGFYLRVTSITPHTKSRYWVDFDYVNVPIPAFTTDVVSINSKARLHIIVNC